MYLAGEIVGRHEPPASTAVATALNELETVYAFIFGRVGNRSDAEDLTQEVALKALPRLREGAPVPAIRAYLFATARSVLASFWSRRLSIPESELTDQMSGPISHPGLEPSAGSASEVTRILSCLPANQRRVLELRFLRGYSVRDIAREMEKSIGSVKVMQLRALRRAAAVPLLPQNTEGRQ